MSSWYREPVKGEYRGIPWIAFAFLPQGVASGGESWTLHILGAKHEGIAPALEEDYAVNGAGCQRKVERWLDEHAGPWSSGAHS